MIIGVRCQTHEGIKCAGKPERTTWLIIDGKLNNHKLHITELMNE